MRKSAPRFTEEEWQRLLPLLQNIHIDRQQAAYRRLVMGTTFVEAGAPFGYSAQDVNFIVKSVLRWWEKLNSLPDKPKPPPGWVTLEVMVPRNHVDDVRRVVEALYPLPQAPALRARKSASQPVARKSNRSPAKTASRGR